MSKSNKECIKHSSYRSLICRVCGDVARGNNFQVITCMSCKSFFRRNAFQPWGILRCHNHYNCIITQKTRIKCPPCRLKKCFAVGMNPNLIRSTHQHQSVLNNHRSSLIKTKKQKSLLTPKLVNFLENDTTNLIYKQWTIFSNVIHQYNQINPKFNDKSIFNKQSSLPPKLRFKSTNVLNMIDSFVEHNKPKIEYSFQLQQLFMNICQAKIKHNLSSINNIHDFFTNHETNLYNDSVFFTSGNELYGSDYVNEIMSICKQLEPNLSFVELMIFVLNFSIVTFDEKKDICIMSNSTDFIQIQHIYITILWKYFINQYGFTETVRRFNSLIKSILIIFRINENLCHNKKA
ncbi:unnamed protein product [Rotaria sordida]|uniref:Nuclear receptor domain-containing protein n=1 Tax=Rotaria sordida TaxID=392033 RepID=A0A814T5G1_9BILA|nr:unnamed protein product [Rotaria sordida]CAF3808008.1 unnamed protein product [Rotaria sordida]